MRDAGPQRSAVPDGVLVAAGWTWRLLLFAVATILVVRALMEVRLVSASLLVALLLSALLAPAVRAVRARGAPAAVAAIIVLGGAVLVGVGVVALIVPAVVTELDDVRDSAVEGVERVSRWAADLGLTGAASGELAEDVGGAIRDNADALGAGAASGALIAAEVVAGILLCLVLTFFLLKDGEGMWRWVLERLPSSRASDPNGWALASGGRWEPTSAASSSSPRSTRSSSRWGCGSSACRWCCRWPC